MTKFLVHSNGMYTYQLYSGGSGTSCTSPRSLRVMFTCNGTYSVQPAVEYARCAYQLTVETPDACGVDFTVGHEAASGALASLI